MKKLPVRPFKQEYEDKGPLTLFWEVVGLVFVMSLCFGSLWLIPVLSDLLGK